MGLLSIHLDKLPRIDSSSTISAANVFKLVAATSCGSQTNYVFPMKLIGSCKSSDPSICGGGHICDGRLGSWKGKQTWGIDH